MVANLSFNPSITTVAPGSFNIDTLGHIQGTVLDSPTARFDLAGGVLAAAETKPLWGGCGVYEYIPALSPYNKPSLGPTIGRATTVTKTGAGGLMGFSVFDQAHHMINTAQSPVPLSLSGMGVHYYRLGSGARVAVKCDPSLVSLQGGSSGQQVSWDFLNDLLQPYIASTETYALTSMTWAANRITVVAAVAVPYGLGDTVTIAGATNSGTGGAAAINKSFVIDTYTDTTNFTLAAPAAAGVFGTIAGSPVIDSSVGALGVTVLDVQVGNSMTVDYDPTTGFATWNRSGSTAIILL